MTKTIRFIIITLSVVLLVSMSSCHTQKSATTDYQSEQTTVTEWQDLYVPVTLNLTSPKSMSISGRATMIRNQCVHISLRVLGLEVAILDVTPEQITAVDKYHQLVVTEPVAQIFAEHDITLADLQDALLGNASDQVIKKIESIPVNLTYGSLTTTTEGSIANYVNVSATVSGKNLDLNLRYKPDQAKWNTGRTVDFSIPSGYKSIDAHTLIENLKID